MSNDLVVLVLANGLTAPQLSESVAELKSASKSVGTHKRRGTSHIPPPHYLDFLNVKSISTAWAEFYWKAYGDILTYLSGKDVSDPIPSHINFFDNSIPMLGCLPLFHPIPWCSIFRRNSLAS